MRLNKIGSLRADDVIIQLYCIYARDSSNKRPRCRDLKASTHLLYLPSRHPAPPCLTHLDSPALRVVLISEVLSFVSAQASGSLATGVKVVWKHLSPSKVSVTFEMVTCFENSLSSFLLFVSRRHPGFRHFSSFSFENSKQQQIRSQESVIEK